MDPARRASTACCAVVAAVNLISASALADEVDPCSGPNVAAYASSDARKCNVHDAFAQQKQPRLLAKQGPVYAGEEIECAADGGVTITFCASRDDQVIGGKDAQKYLVPNVPHKDRQEEKGAAPALRRALGKEPRFAQDGGGKSMEIPTCERKLGTLAVIAPQKKWWVQYNLESPEMLIKQFVSQSKCFTLIERDEQLAAAQNERALSNGEKGRLTIMDYVLVPDIVDEKKSGGSKLGGLFGGTKGALMGGTSTKSKTVDVLLSLSDARSAEQVSISEGHSTKTGSPTTGADGGVGSYGNTEIGQAMTRAYLDAFNKLVEDAKKLPPAK